MYARRLSANVVPIRVGAAEHHIPLQRDATIETVKSIVGRIFSAPIECVKFSYVDEDNDTITINSTAEWYYAVGYLNTRPPPHNVVLVDFSPPFDSRHQAEIEVNVLSSVESSATSSLEHSLEDSSCDKKTLHTVPPVTIENNECSERCHQQDAAKEDESAASPVPNLSPVRSMHGAICDRCHVQIVGNRYKCNDCPDFDFCQQCYFDFYYKKNSVVHTAGHTFTLLPPSSCFGWNRHLRTPASCARGLGRAYCRQAQRSLFDDICKTKTENTDTSTTTTSTSTTSTASTECGDKPRHANIVCDGCGNRDVRGNRWKCAQCFDFDFCDACYAAFEQSCDSDKTPTHNPRHVFIKVRKPATRSSLQVFAPFPNLYSDDVAEDLAITSGALNSISSQMRCYSHKLQVAAKYSESRLASSERTIKVLKGKADKYDAIEEARVNEEQREAEEQRVRQEAERERVAEEARQKAEAEERQRVEEERVRAEAERERLAKELRSAVLEAARKDAEREEAARAQYAKELDLLREMGFSDDLRNLTLLYRHNNVMDVLQKLME